jgi:hypothetical protein
MASAHADEKRIEEGKKGESDEYQNDSYHVGCEERRKPSKPLQCPYEDKENASEDDPPFNCGKTIRGQND